MQSYIKEIESLQNPTFQRIKKISNTSISHLSKDGHTLLWEQLESGVKELNSHELLCQYFWSYGNMHEAKMQKALSKIPNPKEVFSNELTIVDWGCGQGLATVCFFDFLKQQGITNKVQKNILIEPSRMALDRAKLHVNAYVKDESKIKTVCKYLDDVERVDIESNSTVTLHFFSNILDIPQIDLKKLAQNVGENIKGEHYFFCISPYIQTRSHRIDAFYNYFKEPTTFSSEEQSENKLQFIAEEGHLKDYQHNYTLKLRVFKFERNQTYYIPIDYYPAVQFHAAYQLDCIKNTLKKLPNYQQTQFNKFSDFDVSAPFDIGASVYDDVHPIFAVLNNIVTRGLPTKASPFVENSFQKFGNKKAQNDFGAIIFENNDVDLSNTQIIHSPIAIARLQKTILEALMTEKLDVNREEWSVLVVERDVPCATIAFEDLKQMFNNLVALSKDYAEMKFPIINLEIISTPEYVQSPLHLHNKPIVQATQQQKSKKYDIVVDISMTEKDEEEKISFSEFQCNNKCYFNIRSSKTQRTTRHIYTSDTIEYLPLVEKDSQGNYRDLIEPRTRLAYFLQLLFRKEDFRAGQLPILSRALQNKSVIGLLPTGGGKSLTYQLAAMLQPGVTLIIDPLRSLMKDQYDGLRNIGIDTCAYINSALSAQEKDERERQMESSQMQFVFLSPERLCIYKFRERLKRMRDLHVYFAYGVIDEVHCVSEWGHDFRFSYLHLGRNLYNYVCPKNKEKHLTLLGLTATASFDVLADVERELSGNGAFPLDSETTVRYENTNRLELQYKVEKIVAQNIRSKWDIFRAKNEQLHLLISQIPNLINELQSSKSIQRIKEKFVERENLDKDKNKTEIEEIKKAKLNTEISEEWLQQESPYQQGGIIFCPHTRGSLGIHSTPTNRGVSDAITTDLECYDIGTFKGGDEMTDQDRFINNEVPIMVATKAFGMGIDKPNVRFTTNINMSSSLEGFVQEAGRAGRDRRMALATILYSDYGDADKEVQMFFYDNNFKGAVHEKQVMHELLSQKQINFFISQDDNIEIQETSTVSGFLTTLLNSEPNQNIISFISYRTDTDYEGFDKYEYIAKAIYRMCCIDLVDDFTQDYTNSRFRIVTKRKQDGEYYQGLKRFLLRYYSEERAEEEIQKVPNYRGENEVHKCLGYLTEFIYEKIAVKRKRAIDDMNSFCIQGLDDSKDWKETNEDLKDFIYYYFNSKYAKEDYETENGEPFSLTTETDKGKISSFDLLFKYLRVVNEDVYGSSGSPKDSVKHLQGAVRLIRRSLTDANPSLALLNAFCLSYLGTNKNETLEQELENSYKEGYICFYESSDKNVFYHKINELNEVFASIHIQKRILKKMQDWATQCELNIHANWLNNFHKTYTK